MYLGSVTLSIGFFRSSKSYKTPRFSADFCGGGGANVGNKIQTKRHERNIFRRPKRPLFSRRSSCRSAPSRGSSSALAALSLSGIVAGALLRHARLRFLGRLRRLPP